MNSFSGGSCSVLAGNINNTELMMSSIVIGKQEDEKITLKNYEREKRLWRGFSTVEII